MSLAVGVVTQELLHAEDSDAPRLNKLLREFEIQGAFVRFSSKIVDSTIREIGDRLSGTAIGIVWRIGAPLVTKTHG